MKTIPILMLDKNRRSWIEYQASYKGHYMLAGTRMKAIKKLAAKIKLNGK